MKNNFNSDPAISQSATKEEIRTILSATIDGCYLVDLQGHILETNDSYCSMIGYSREELLKMSVKDIEAIETQELIQKRIDKILNTGSDRFETRHIRKDGKIILIEASVNFLNDGNPRLYCFMRDITERNRAEEKVRQLAAIVQSSEDAIIGKNLDGIITTWNKGAENIFGYSESEIVGKSISILYPPGNVDELSMILEKIKSGENIKHFETVRRRKDGQPIQMSLTVSPILNADGKIVAASVIGHDITIRKKSELDLIRAKDQAESANRLKDAFIANISHEIRTPLNGILGMTSLIKEMFQNNIKKEDEEIFEGIDFSSNRIIRTIDMILNYSRLHIGEYNIKPGNISLSKICANLIKEFNTSAKHKSLELSFQNNCGESVIFADEYSITMAISNLIDNAIKFTAAGYVRLILDKKNSGEIILEIKDSGVGIDKDYLNNIFEPYRQEQMGYGRAYEGIGLGLAIVKKVISLNNAVITVESKKGDGTAFFINFGRMNYGNDLKVEPERAPGSPPIGEKSSKITILLVEDDALNQMTIKRFVEKKYSCIVTDSSDNVKEILRRGHIDLILMDISIKGSRNGLELTKELKASKEFAHLPVIAVTAHAFKEDRQNALASGCDNFLSKPFSKQDLFNIISLYLKQ
jgi:PAS domain S-box-containing protein